MSDEYSLGSNFQAGKIDAETYRVKMARLGFGIAAEDAYREVAEQTRVLGKDGVRYFAGHRVFEEGAMPEGKIILTAEPEAFSRLLHAAFGVPTERTRYRLRARERAVRERLALRIAPWLRPRAE